MKPKGALFFFAVFSAVFLALFYNTVTNMAGVYIAYDLGGDHHIAVYPMVFFGLGNALTIPLTRFLAMQFGPGRLYFHSLLFYTLLSFLSGFAPTFFLFNVCRFGLGIASGPLYLLASLCMTHFAPPVKKALYTSLMLSLFAVVPVLGACFGAWLAYESHWAWIFRCNEPVALTLAFYFWHALKEEQFRLPQQSLDSIGYGFYAIGLTALVTAATISQQIDWYRSSLFLVLLAIGIPSFLFFILWELNSDSPLLELKLLKNFSLAFALINFALLFSTYFGMIILIALWLNIYVNYTPTWISVILATMAIAGFIPLLLTRQWMRSERKGFLSEPLIPLALALIFFISSCYYSTYFDVEIDFWRLSIARSLAGFGIALFIPPIFRIALTSYPEEKGAQIFTLLQVTRALFSSLGAGLYVILWQRRQVFFHERLGEQLTIYSQLTSAYMQRATQIFQLTPEQAKAELGVLLENQATSLALNDVFAFMGYVLSVLLLLLIFKAYRDRRSKEHKTLTSS